MNTALNKSDLLCAFACIQEIGIASNHDEFIASLIRTMHPLMRAKVTGYNEADPIRKRFAFVVHPRHVLSDAIIRAWVAHAGENPLLQYAQRNPRDFSVRKITDFVPQKIFRRTKLCQKIYARFGAEYQIALFFPSIGSASIALVFNRATDFTERDRQLLSLLQPILAALYTKIQRLDDMEFSDQSFAAISKPRRDALANLRLSPREKEVLAPLLEGETNKQIAATLKLSTRTVEKYVEILLRKLNVPTRAAACSRYHSHSD